jgi:peptidoglycan/LPS O-acetylase OafA/YrhL
MNTIVPALGTWIGLSLRVALVLGLAYGIHRLVERHFNARFRRWLEPRLSLLDRVADAAALRVALRFGPF